MLLARTILPLRLGGSKVAHQSRQDGVASSPFRWRHGLSCRKIYGVVVAPVQRDGSRHEGYRERPKGYERRSGLPVPRYRIYPGCPSIVYFSEREAVMST